MYNGPGMEDIIYDVGEINSMIANKQQNADVCELEQRLDLQQGVDRLKMAINAIKPSKKGGRKSTKKKEAVEWAIKDLGGSA